jgi:hypothetical protein
MEPTSATNARSIRKRLLLLGRWRLSPWAGWVLETSVCRGALSECLWKLRVFACGSASVDEKDFESFSSIGRQECLPHRKRVRGDFKKEGLNGRADRLNPARV